MKDNRDVLEKELLCAIYEAHKNSKIDVVKNKLITTLSDYFSHSKIILICNNSIPLSSLNVYELYLLSNQFIKNKWININVSEWFTDTEISEATKNKLINENKYENEVVFKNVLFNGSKIDEQYITIINYKELSDLYISGKLSYNLQTQRESKTIKYKGKILRVPTINQQSVDDITKEVEEGTFKSNMITLNILVDGNDKFNYYDSELHIDSSSQIDIIDGQHRISGIVKAINKNNSIDGYMFVCIKHYDVDKCRAYILQESKGNYNTIINKALYDSNSNVAKLINYINTDSNKNNLFFNKICSGVEDNDSIVYYDIFATSMMRAFNNKLDNITTTKIIQLKEFIISFYSIAYELILEKLNYSKINQLDNTIWLDQYFICGFLNIIDEIINKNDSFTIDINIISKIIERLTKINESDIKKYTYENSKSRYEIEGYDKEWRSIAKKELR